MDLIEAIEGLPELFPRDLFSYTFQIPYAESFPKKMKNLSSPFIEEEAGEVALAWNEEALFVRVLANSSVEKCSLPDFRSGDSVELLIDTRDRKSASSATRFCHHFVIFPEKVQEFHGHEVTRFRTAESRPLAPPEAILVDVDTSHSSYTLNITLKSDILVGYDPLNFPRLGFLIRWNRFQEDAALLTLSPLIRSIEQLPKLWPSLQLSKKA